MTVDAKGGVWVALNGGGAVQRYTPEGMLDEVVEVATRKVTSCAFGGRRLDELFITTSREGLEPDDDALAGALFRAHVGVTGLPVSRIRRVSDDLPATGREAREHPSQLGRAGT